MLSICPIRQQHTHTYTYIHRYYVDGSDSARERGLQAQQTQILDTLHGDLENKTEVKCVCVYVYVYTYIYIYLGVCVCRYLYTYIFVCV
jgi:hypothetical protein